MLCSMEHCIISRLHEKFSNATLIAFSWVCLINMGLINKVDMVCLSPVGYGV